MLIRGEPGNAFCLEVVARGVVDAQDHLPPIAADQPLEEAEKGVAVEHVSEREVETCVVQRDCPEDVRGLALAASRHPRLLAYTRPSTVNCGVELEAGFVLQEDHSPEAAGCFFSLGNVSRNQNSWASWSARLSFLRGRWTLNPSLCSNSGTYFQL